MSFTQVTPSLVVYQPDSGNIAPIPSGSVSDSNIVAGVQLIKISGVAAGSIPFVGASPNFALGEDNTHLFYDSVNLGLRVGTNAVANSGNLETLSVLSSFTANPSAQTNGISTVLSASGNFALTQATVANRTAISRTITLSQTDTAQISAVAIGAALLNVSAGQTLTNTNGTGYSAINVVVSPTISGGGSIAYSTWRGINIQTSTVNTGTTKIGLLIGAQTGATNNCSIADNVTYSGTWFLNSNSNSPSYFAGNIGIGTSTSTPGCKLDVSQVTATMPAVIDSTVIAHLTGADGNANRFQMNTFGGTNYINPQRANGTSASLTTLVLDDQIFTISSGGYNGTAYNPVGTARMIMAAAGTWTNTSTPTYLRFETTPVNSTSSSERMRIDSNGLVGIGITPSFELHVTGTTTAGLQRIMGNANNLSASIASAGTFTPTISATNGGGMFIITDATGGASALVYFFFANGLTIVSQSGAEFAITASPSATQTGLQYVSSTGVLTVKNGFAGSRQYCVTVFGT